MNELETIINKRIKLQTVQKSLETKFGLKFPTLNKIKSAQFIEQYSSWDQTKRKSFAIELGGPINVYYTKNYLENLTKY